MQETGSSSLVPAISRDAIRSHAWSASALLAANAFPLLGVLFLGWQTFDIVFLYWVENVVIGIINVMKMLSCSPSEGTMHGLIAKIKAEPARGDSGSYSMQDWAKSVEKRGMGAVHLSKLFFVPFFIVHYGLFCTVHLVFVCVLTAEGGPFLGGDAGPATPALQALSQPGTLIAIAALFVSHLVSFTKNYIGRGEYRKTVPPMLMMQPYARIVVLHIALIASGFVSVMLGSPFWLLLILVVGKTWLDLALHLREHRQADEHE